MLASLFLQSYLRGTPPTPPHPLLPLPIAPPRPHPTLAHVAYAVYVCGCAELHLPRGYGVPGQCPDQQVRRGAPARPLLRRQRGHRQGVLCCPARGPCCSGRAVVTAPGCGWVCVCLVDALAPGLCRPWCSRGAWCGVRASQAWAVSGEARCAPPPPSTPHIPHPLRAAVGWVALCLVRRSRWRSCARCARWLLTGWTLPPGASTYSRTLVRYGLVECAVGWGPARSRLAHPAFPATAARSGGLVSIACPLAAGLCVGGGLKGAHV